MESYREESGGLSLKGNGGISIRTGKLYFRKLSLAEVENRQLIPQTEADKMRVYEDKHMLIYTHSIPASSSYGYPYLLGSIPNPLTLSAREGLYRNRQNAFKKGGIP